MLPRSISRYISRNEWAVLAREYNPTDGSDYYREEATGIAVFLSVQSTMRIQFNESDLEFPADAIENGEIFTATYRVDGESPVALRCYPRGVR